MRYSPNKIKVQIYELNAVIRKIMIRLVPQPEVEAEKKDDKHRQEIEVRPPPPFPQRLQMLKDESKYKTLLDILIQVRVNLPLIEVLQDVPKYAKYLRDIVANKRRLTQFEIVALTEECNARVQSKLPPKLMDPCYFTIPLAIGKHEVGRALCDVGARINLMPLSVFKQLDLGAPIPTTITLQLPNQSLVVLKGIIEDVLVRVGKFIFPPDFIILDYMVDEAVPIILGRPFLATCGALIDVREGELKMRVHDEEITCNVYKAFNLPKHYEDLCMISVVESKLIEQGSYLEPTGMEKKIELEEVVLPAKCVMVKEKRVREERGDPPRARKKAKLHGKRRKRKRPA
nr:uncharacterized protein LOC104103391 [Nicotiana tomentosiformis]